jgi:hypothetical protein
MCGHHDAEIEEAIGRAGASYVLPMYEYYATPLRTNGCGKLNICFRQKAFSAPPSPSLLLDVAMIEWPFNLKAFASAPPNTQTRYILDLAHAALLASGSHLGWSLDPAIEAYGVILQKAIRFEFVWRKPKSSPDRKLRVQVEVDFRQTVRLYVTFLAPNGQALLRKLFSVVGPGLGCVAAVLGRIEWIDNTLVKITHQNDRDYWLCGADGSLDFFFPRAARGEPHGLFELGRMYCEGLYVLRDLVRGRTLVEAAARKGYHHAIQYLRKSVEPGASPNGGPAEPSGNSGIVEGPPSVS